MTDHARPTPLLQKALAFAALFYITVYAFESPIRFGLSKVGADPLIFLRDALLFGVLGGVFVIQAARRSLHPAFFIYVFVVGFHGLIMILNIGSYPAVIYSAKMLLSLLYGAVAADVLFAPTPRLIRFFAVLWAVTVVAVLLHKYDLIQLPWSGMKTTIGNLQVEVNRDWLQSTGFDKRAAGLTRSSIHAASLMSMLGFILLFHAPRVAQRIVVGVLTLFALYCTTQKGAILSFAVILMIMAVSGRRFVQTGRIWLVMILALMVGAPLVLPGYIMPAASGVFSMESFYERVEWMWPITWDWLRHADVFPFGVGLGGIGGAQRFYDSPFLPASDAADNMFVFMYLNFGVLALVYLGWVVVQAFRVKGGGAAPAQAIATVCFILGYGVFISIFEDMMQTLFLGGAVATLAMAARRKAPPPPGDQAPPPVPEERPVA